MLAEAGLLAQAEEMRSCGRNSDEPRFLNKVTRTH
jgi:hypothetical protein